MNFLSDWRSFLKKEIYMERKKWKLFRKCYDQTVYVLTGLRLFRGDIDGNSQAFPGVSRRMFAYSCFSEDFFELVLFLRSLVALLIETAILTCLKFMKAGENIPSK